MKQMIHFCLVLALAILLCACKEKATPPLESPQEQVTFDEGDISPEAGGPGFLGDGWESNAQADSFADPNARKGGALRVCIASFPNTLRVTGRDSNFTVNGIMRDLLYESLLRLNPNTLEFVPGIASHWQILRDSKTFRFRLNPRARWADGTPITTKDVLATWKLLIDEGLENPYLNKLYLKFYKPVPESLYIFHVTAKELNWHLFLNFASMALYPAHVLAKLDGASFLKEYQWKTMLGSGPYEHSPELSEDQKKITFSHRENYWGEEEKFQKGLYNFGRIEFIVEGNDEKAFERFKQGEFDALEVNVARRWVKETNFPEIQRGLIQKRKIYNQAPQGYSGIAFNMRMPPLHDLRVRAALAFLYNREKMISDFFFNEYEPLDSYFPGSIYANPKNPKVRFDPAKAMSLLAEAGWKEKNKDGWLVKDGKIFSVTMLCPPALQGFMEKIYVSDLKKAGIELLFEKSDSKKTSQHEFEMAFMSWSGLAFPNPESAWSSSLADVPNSNNICGLKLEKVDRICDAHAKMFLQRQRIEALRELDAILMGEHPYALGWGINSQRFLYWNRFSYPEHYLSRTGRFFDILMLWSFSPEKEKKLQEAKANPQIQLPVGELKQTHWITSKE